MKKLLLIFIMFSALNCIAQESAKIQLPLKDSAIIYEDIVIMADTNISGDKLYTLAQTWFADTFKSSKSVLQVNDRQSSKLIGKGVSLYLKTASNYPDQYLYYTIEVVVKNGRYRYRIYNFGLEAGSLDQNLDMGYSHYLHNEYHKELFESRKNAALRYEKIFVTLNKIALDLISSLKSSMSDTKKDDF